MTQIQKKIKKGLKRNTSSSCTFFIQYVDVTKKHHTHTRTKIIRKTYAVIRRKKFPRCHRKKMIKITVQKYYNGVKAMAQKRFILRNKTLYLMDNLHRKAQKP